MAYEYESRISNSIDRDKNYFFTTTSKDMKNELQEVYRKAKAFDEIVKSLNESYVDTYNPVTKTTSYNVLNHHNLANEVEEIILSNGLNNESGGQIK
ncbi:hypothetical protein QI264_03760 [Staphylococcus saprophyticus]|nr:hypothetical protein [Staphylococcus saprophyticus]